MFSKLTRFFKKNDLKISNDDFLIEKLFTNARSIHEKIDSLIEEKNNRFSKKIIVIHGVGAVGKSTALRMSRLKCRREGISAVLVDTIKISSVTGSTEITLLEEWVRLLVADGLNFKKFNSTKKRYIKIKNNITNNSLSSDVNKIVSEITKQIPNFGTIMSPISGKSAEIFINWLRNNLSTADFDFYINPVREFTNSFLKDIETLGNPIVLMLDTYEKAVSLDNWLSKLTANLSNNAVLIIAGREIPDFERTWPGYLLIADFVHLKEMTSDDIRELINKAYSLRHDDKMPDPKLVDPIVDFAHGLPIIAILAVTLWTKYGIKDFKELKPRVISEVVDRLLEDVPDEMKSAFKAASILRYFDIDSLRALLPQSDVEKLYDELKDWPFVRSSFDTSDQLSIHETMRVMINEENRRRSPNEFRKLHKLAAQFYESQFESKISNKLERLKFEFLYHKISSDEKSGIPFFQEIAEELANSMLFNSLKGLLIDLNNYDLELLNSKLWVKYYNARLNEFEQNYLNAKNVYESISQNSNVESKLRAYAKFDLGRLYANPNSQIEYSDLSQAIKLLKQSLEISPQEDLRLIQAYAQLYNIEIHNCNFEGSLKYLYKQQKFYEKKNIKEGLLSTLSNFKDAYSILGDWKQVYQVSHRADEIFNSLPESPVLRSLLEYCPWVYIWSGRYSESEIVIRNAIKFHQEKKSTYPLLVFKKDLCLSLGMQGKYKEALENFSELGTRHQELNNKYYKEKAGLYGYWGLILLKQGDLNNSKIYLTESLDMKQNIKAQDHLGTPEVLLWLGELYETKALLEEGEMKDELYKKSESYYKKSLQLRSTCRYYYLCGCLSGLARISYRNNNYEAMNGYIIEAELIAKKYEYNDHLAFLRLLQGNHQWLSQTISSPSKEIFSDKKIKAITKFYKESIVYALRYNRFLLDEVLSGQILMKVSLIKPIIINSIQQSEIGCIILNELYSWWMSGVNKIDNNDSESISQISIGMKLSKAEKKVRKYEIGNGMPQKTVVEKLEEALLLMRQK